MKELAENIPSNYTINYHIDDLIEIYSKKWAMEWMKKYHPEVLDRAKLELTKLAESVDNDTKKFSDFINNPK